MADSSIPTTKRCSVCGRDLPGSAFVKHRRSSDGLYSRCKACHRSTSRPPRVSDGRKQTLRPSSAPASGMKRCASCEQELPRSAFGKLSRSADGLHYWCRSCNAAKVRSQRQELRKTDPVLPPSGMKRCGSCGQELSIAAFGKLSRSADRLHYNCRSCVAAKSRSQREVLRKTDPERWRARRREEVRR
jgi:CRISPR/Cas system-associated protein Cas10 (large subunit of type III CRISPR-Cas system)